MNVSDCQIATANHWFAINTKNEFKAEKVLTTFCEEIFFPTQNIKIPGKRTRKKAVIPHVLFIKTSSEHALQLEKKSRESDELPFSFWIYRYPDERHIRSIPQSSIDLLRMLTSDDTSRCQIFNHTDFREKQRVRVLNGLYQGYEGYVVRVKKNKHVVVKIEGVCMVMLPFIHPDLLEPID